MANETPPDLLVVQPALKDGNDSDSIVALFASLSHMLNLHICYHDRLGLAPIPHALKEHINPACLHIKARKQRECSAYDAVETHAALASRPEGRINHCHAGYTEIAVPVYCDGSYVGVLFAGPLLDVDSPEPAGIPKDLLPRRAPSAAWLEDCRQLLLAAASRMGQILRPNDWPSSSDRRRAIYRFVCAEFAKDLALPDLAKELHLSESRAGHLVKQIFKMPFSELVESFRLRNAAELLSSSDLPVSDVAYRSGFKDQNYFSRRFKKSFGLPPLQYRKAKRR